MTEYPKIHTIFKRDPATKHKTLLLGEFSLPEFEYLQHNQWVFTEKVDGTNIRVMCTIGGGVLIGGKTDNASIPSKLVARLHELFTPQAFASAFTEGLVCLYGEGYGAGIQSGGIYRPDQDFVLFDVKVGDWWLQRKDVEDVAAKMGLDVVPVVGVGPLIDMIAMVEDGSYESQWKGVTPEGIVARPAVELKTRSGDRIITKLKRKDFR